MNEISFLKHSSSYSTDHPSGNENVLFTSIHCSIGIQPVPFPCNSSLEYWLRANMIFIMQSTSNECFKSCHSIMAAYKPPIFLCLDKFCAILIKMPEFCLFLVKTEIFYEFSKWRKIEIRKPITKPRNLPKGNGSSVMWPLKSTWLFRLNTKRSYKRQGHATFEALCWLFCAMVESRNNGRLT